MRNREAVRVWREVAGEKPSVSFYSPGKRFTQRRRETPFAPVRCTLKHQADAWQRAFAGGGFPRFRSRRGDHSITLPTGTVRLRGGKLHFPKLGPMVLRRHGGSPWSDGEPVLVVVRRVLGRWYATVCYEAGEVACPDNGLALGVEMNAGQGAVSNADIVRAPDTSRLEARRRRYQRMMARRRRGSKRPARARQRASRTVGRISTIRANWCHQVSRVLADTAGMAVVEYLLTKAMTASAKGTAEALGSNVRQKAGLNRAIIDNSWGALRRNLQYKVAVVVTLSAAHTSQRCHRCGTVNAASRRTQPRFACVSCGHESDADILSATNCIQPIDLTTFLSVCLAQMLDFLPTLFSCLRAEFDQ